MRPLLVFVVCALALSCSDPTPDIVRVDASLEASTPDVSARDAVVTDAAGDVSVSDVSMSDVPVRDAPSRLRVLFVGNSYTYVNDLPALIAAMSTMTPGPVIEVESVTVGGATMRDHWEGAAAPARVMAGPWDAVVLQGQSVEPVLNYDAFRTYGVRFGMLVASRHARPLYYATWPRRAGDALYNESWSGGTPEIFNGRLDLAYSRVAALVMGDVAHVGNAWVAAQRALPSINLYDPDGSHPSPAGTWLAGCVIYRALTGLLVPLEADRVAAGVTPADARALRELVASQP